MIVVNAIKATGVKHANQIFKQTVMSGLIAAIALVFIYVSLGFIGNHMNVDNATLKNLTAKDQNVGAYLLTTMAANGFGVFGKYFGYYRCTRLFNNCLWLNCICKSIF